MNIWKCCQSNTPRFANRTVVPGDRRRIRSRPRPSADCNTPGQWVEGCVRWLHGRWVVNARSLSPWDGITRRIGHWARATHHVQPGHFTDPSADAGKHEPGAGAFAPTAALVLGFRTQRVLRGWGRFTGRRGRSRFGQCSRIGAPRWRCVRPKSARKAVRALMQRRPAVWAAARGCWRSY